MSLAWPLINIEWFTTEFVSMTGRTRTVYSFEELVPSNPRTPQVYQQPESLPELVFDEADLGRHPGAADYETQEFHAAGGRDPDPVCE